jgi:peptide/nickel transport system permease protein
MVPDNVVGLSLNRWATLAPVLCIVALVVSVNLLADRAADRFRRSI